MALRFDIGKDEAILARAHRIRHEVFVIEQQIDPSIEWDAFDEGAFHFVAIDDQTGDDIGTGRLQFMSDAIKLQRIAILKAMRGHNAGLELVAFMLSWGSQNGDFARAELDAQTYAIPFYEKLGFKAYGEPYEEADIPHRHMRLFF